MKKLLLLAVVLTGFISLNAQNIAFKAGTVVGGTTLDRGGEFDYIIYANGMNNSTTRQLLFDIQYDLANFQLVSVNHTGTGGNGGILPQNSTINLSYYDYNGYSYNRTNSNTTDNGTTNYQNASYTYNQNNANSILRVTLSWATTSAMPYNSYSDFIKVRFKIKSTSTAYSFNPIKLNFVAGWNKTGGYDATYQENPLSTTVMMNQNYGKYVTARVDLNSNLYNLSALKLSFRDTVTNTGVLFPILSDGSVDINQTQLADNKVYEVSVMHNMDKIYAIYNGAITISDFTTAQGEFTSMGLDGSNGQILKTGQSLYAADINRNKVIDGGDLPRLLAQVVGIDTLNTLPASYNVGSGGYMNLPTWKSTDVTTIAGQTEWLVVEPNGYGSNVSRVYIDMRKFAGVGVTPEQVKSLQIFDIYSGPVEFVSQDAAWAFYKVPSNLSKVNDGTSIYSAYIRNINNSNTSFGLRAEFAFDADPSHSWGSITTSNWKDFTIPHTYFKTTTLGTNAFLDLKYLLWGDVNRSHSSQVITTNNGSSIIQTNAANSLSTNTAFVTMATANTGFINTSTGEVSSIDVNLSNITVTSNNVEIPVNLDTKGIAVGGLQFEFQYDPTKIKFEELKSEVPNTWYLFVNSKDGKVKFGAIDQNNKTPINGNLIPFKLKFSTIGDGVDILTSVKVSPTMDASSSKGVQLGINLNSTQIKLTGYNNF